MWPFQKRYARLLAIARLYNGSPSKFLPFEFLQNFVIETIRGFDLILNCVNATDTAKWRLLRLSFLSLCLLNGSIQRLDQCVRELFEILKYMLVFWPYPLHTPVAPGKRLRLGERIFLFYFHCLISRQYRCSASILLFACYC